MKTPKIWVLDGSPEEEDAFIKALFDSFTPEEDERAMSDEFAYLDED